MARSASAAQATQAGGSGRGGAVPAVSLPGEAGGAGGRPGGDCLRYLDNLFREYLTYRGLTATLAVFGQELATEPTAGFRAEAVCELLFQRLLPAGELPGLLDILDFLRSRFFSRLAPQLQPTAKQMETALLRLYVATHWRAGREDLVAGFFATAGPRLLQGPDAEEWRGWFALPHVPAVAGEPHMKAFFTPEWAQLAEASFRNFLAQALAAMPQPTVLGFSRLRQKRKELQRQVEILEEENSALRRLLADADRAHEEARGGQVGPAAGGAQQGPAPAAPPRTAKAAPQSSEATERWRPSSGPPGRADSAHPGGAAEAGDRLVGGSGGAWATGLEALRLAEEDTREVDPSVLETMSGHQAAVTVCRFSPGGQHVASGAADGTVRIWAPGCTRDGPDSHTRAASFQAGGPILSLDWDRRANKIMLVGTSMAGVKAWHLDTCRVVGEVRPQAVSEPMGHVLALAASPTEAVFAASMATSAAAGWQAAGRLTLWNMRTFLKAATLPLDAASSADAAGMGAEDTAVVSLDFSRDGRLLGAGCSDGSVRLFDMAAGARSQVMAWTVSHGGGACSSLRFADDGKSVVTLSGNGMLQEWALAKGPASAGGGGLHRLLGSSQLLASCDVGQHCSTLLGGAQSRSNLRHHLAVSPDAQAVALTSNSGLLPIARRRGAGWSLSTSRVALHPASIACVDWHPSSGIVASGSDSQKVVLSSAD
eukprot:jgi/Tetstr1/439858/TSEL_028269.t1